MCLKSLLSLLTLQQQYLQENHLNFKKCWKLYLWKKDFKRH